MPVYPIFPITIAFENPTDIEPNIIKSSYGIGGITKSALKGINPDQQRQQIQINTTKFDEVDQFLETNRNRPFRLSLDGGITDDGKLYKLYEYSWTYISPDVRGFSGEMVQVRRFR